MAIRTFTTRRAAPREWAHKGLLGDGVADNVENGVSEEFDEDAKLNTRKDLEIRMCVNESSVCSFVLALRAEPFEDGAVTANKLGQSVLGHKLR